jgi:protein TonB
MELKKNPEIDINRKRGLFFSIGLTISLSLVILAFEYKTPVEGDLVDLGKTKADFDEIVEIPPTEQPPPPPVKTLQMPQVIEVPDEQEIEEEIEINLDVEITEEMAIEEFIYDEVPMEEEVEEIFTIVEQAPMYKGGNVAMYNYLGKELRYPSVARRMGIEGRVFVQFVVDKDGKITDVLSLKGIGGGCDEEAVRVVSSMPSWNPGKQRGKPVKVRMVLPVFFRLKDNDGLTAN